MEKDEDVVLNGGLMVLMFYVAQFVFTFVLTLQASHTNARGFR